MMHTLLFFEADAGLTVTFSVVKPDGTPYNLTGATVTWVVEGVGSFACTVTDPTGGVCTRTVAAADFTRPGRYRAQLKVTSGSSVFHSHIFTVQVSEPLA